MRRILSAMLALGVLATAQLTAQEGVKPGPEHALLKESVGTWDASVKAGSGDTTKGTCTCAIGLNNLWLFEHFKGEVAGMPFEGRGATSYDPAKKKFVNIWIDSMSASPMVSEGTYDKATKTMTLYGNMPMPDGKTMKATLTTVAKDVDTKVFTLKGSADGKDIEMVQITYTRRAK